MRCTQRLAKTVGAVLALVVAFATLLMPAASASVGAPLQTTTYVTSPHTYDISAPLTRADSGPKLRRGQPVEPLAMAAGKAMSFPSVGVAAKSGDDLVDVWRVVGPDEAAQIGKTGSYQVQLGGEGKYFFPTREQAENLGQMYTKQGWGGQQTLTRGQAPRSVIDRAEPVNAGTEGPGWFVRSPDIPSICNVTCVGPVG